MRIGVGGLALVVVGAVGAGAACTEAATSTPAAQPPSGAAASAAAGASSTTTTTTTTTTMGGSGGPGFAGGAPLFTYVEGGDELSFWPPVTLRLVRGGSAPRTCTSELSTGRDNMWTGPDVEAAIADRDVQSALARGRLQSYLPELDDAGALAEGLLKTATGSLEWKVVPCHGCVPPPPGIVRLHRVLAGVMMNRRLLCG